MPTFGSLFAGIGGIDLGLERAGWECRWQVEWDPFCQHVLAKHWPDIPRWGDITAVDFTRVERVDLLAGGFPCQPVSAAGQQRGQDDERWLWPEFARAIRDLRPSYVLVENVANLLAVSDGAAFGEVAGDLAALGYDKQWDCIPASAFGAPHERNRLWIVAYTERHGGNRITQSPARHDSDGPDAGRTQAAGRTPGGGEVADAESDGWSGSRSADPGRDDPATSREPVRTEPARDGPGGGAGVVADTDGSGLPIGEWRRVQGGAWVRYRSERPGDDPLADADLIHAQGVERSGDDPTVGQEPSWRPTGLRSGTGRHRVGPAQSRVVRAPDGVPSWMDGHRWPAPPGPQYEWEPPRTVVGRLPNRAARVKALGNAVVPQVVEWLGRQLLAALERAA